MLLLAILLVVCTLSVTCDPVSDADVKAFFDSTVAPHVGPDGMQAVAMTYFSLPSGSNTPHLVSFSAGTCYNLDGKATGAPQPASTMFRIGSVTKVYTSTALWQLYEQGRLDLDARIEDLLPSLAPRMDGHRITVRDLLRHTVPLDEPDIGILMKGDGVPSLNALEAVETYAWTAWTRAPDAPRGISYINAGSAIGGAIIEKITGMTIDEYFKRYIYQPVGANRTAFHRELHGDYSNVCFPPDAQTKCSAPYEMIARAAGDLYATPEDLARFLAGHVANQSTLFIKSDTAAAMHKRAYPAFDILPETVYHGEANLWKLETFRGVRIVGKAGDALEASGKAYFFPETQDGFYVVGTLQMAADDPLGAIDIERLQMRFVSLETPNQNSTRVVFANSTDASGTKYMVATFDADTKKCLQIELLASEQTLRPLTVADNSALVTFLLACAGLVALASILAFLLVPLWRVRVVRVHQGFWIWAPFAVRHSGSARDPRAAIAAQQSLQHILATSTLALFVSRAVVAATFTTRHTTAMNVVWIASEVCWVVQVALVFALCLCVLVRCCCGAVLPRNVLIGWAILFVLNAFSMPGLILGNVMTFRIW
ncbi:hypothetical protein RI367_006439 [Sorochytrium milnesiophthora]